MGKYLNLAGAQYLVNKVKGLISVKADKETVNAALAEKASTTQLTEGLAGKADTATVNAALAEKATTTALNEGLAGKANNATTLAGYGIGDAYTSEQTDAKIAAAITANNETINGSLGNVYTKEEIDAKVASVYVFKGSVANYAALPTEGNEVGHVYNIEAGDETHGINAGDNVAWDGSKWDKLAGTITFDTSDLLPVDSVISNEEIDGLFVEA